ncbi:GTP diphosphokinase [Aliikangiella sp. G2MR2-5]|uniref:GTP diphosphokinase n=1 Tax=Aliikangiella sp. G2MR2-5 TaxID=2788943 RepID=UPI0018ABC26B|nr:GTP diphosphokinase [Aliikangiella sp. G2MR2-5]
MVKVYDIKTPVGIEDENFDTWCQSIRPESEPNRDELWASMVKLIAQIKHDTDKANVDAENKKEKTTHKTLKELLAEGFEMANILSSLNANSGTLISAILYPLVQHSLLTLDQVSNHCPPRIVTRIKGVATMDAIRSLQSDMSHNQDASHIDNLRKMLLTMVDDVRVVLIKLAERLYLLRKAAKSSEENRYLIAREVSDVYAPLANRLGVGQIKWEMEDLAFRILREDDYKKIAKNLAEKRTDREVYVKNVLSIIKISLDELGVEADLQGRAKHIYSIWKKMQRKDVGFEEIYDVRAVRVLVPKVQDCYSVLGVVHGLWKHIPKEFDDYIATPKENGYRSLHTAVVGPEGKTLEIQIRTFDMHQESELGVAAHWKYKEGKGAPSDGYEAKIAWLRQLLEWQDELTESADLVEEFKNQVLEERIYVFTPQGKLIDLPKGSTAVDFAYRVHTEVGHRCRGAKVNGRIIQLTEPLDTGQRIEILTAKSGGPSRDWLSEHKGYIRSSRARSKVHQWFRHQDKDKNAAAGKQLIEKELQKHNIKNVDFDQVARHFNYNKVDELYAGIGSGDKGLHQVLNQIRSLQSNEPKIDRNTVIKKTPKVGKRTASSDILVEGVGNLLTRMAGCCKPVPGDEICGFVSQGRGIMIHRADCRYLLNSRAKSPEKILDVEWSHAVNENYLIDLLIKAYDRKGLLGDVTTLMADEKVSVTSLNTHVNKKRLMVSINIQIEVPSVSTVSKIMTKLEQLPTIVSVQRK